MKRIFALFLSVLLLILAACSPAPAEPEEETKTDESLLNGVFIEDLFTGYSFNSDGVVIYYEANWYKPKNAPTQCNPEYWVGTYTLEGKALTITLSGIDGVITGVVMSDDVIVIDGITCKQKTTSYFAGENYDEDAKCWAELDKMIGLE